VVQDNFIARWRTDLDARFVRIDAFSAALGHDGNTQIDAIMAFTAPEAPSSTTKPVSWVAPEDSFVIIDTTRIPNVPIRVAFHGQSSTLISDISYRDSFYEDLDNNTAGFLPLEIDGAVTPEASRASMQVQIDSSVGFPTDANTRVGGSFGLRLAGEFSLPLLVPLPVPNDPLQPIFNINYDPSFFNIEFLTERTGETDATSLQIFNLSGEIADGFELLELTVIEGPNPFGELFTFDFVLGSVDFVLGSVEVEAPNVVELFVLDLSTAEAAAVPEPGAGVLLLSFVAFFMGYLKSRP